MEWQGGIVFTIADEVFRVLPTLCVGVVTAHGIDNTGAHTEVDAMLDEAVADAKRRLEGMNASDDPRVQPYRKAFHALGMSPSRYPSSNIALLRRVVKGKALWKVNPVVDLGNVISITYALPLGAHALETPDEKLCLRFSRADDVFVALGEDAPDPTLAPGELVYAVGNLVHTRRWTWRQSEHGKIVPETTDIIFPIDGFTDQNEDQVRAAAADLERRLQEVFGCTTSFGLADAGHPSVG